MGQVLLAPEKPFYVVVVFERALKRGRRMAAKQMSGSEGLRGDFAGMSKNQLYEIMSQMKTLIEQNQQQAKQILVSNPQLTQALFQAQIMLGMVKPPQVMPNIQQTLSQHPQQSVQPGQQLNVQAAQSLPVQTSSSQPQISARQQQPNQAFVPIPPASIPPASLPSQTAPSHSLQAAQQAKVHLTSQPTSIQAPQSSQIHNPPPLPLHSAPPPSALQSPMPTVPSQTQSLPTTGNLHQPLQPPLPPQPRPPSIAFPHQLHSHVGPNMGFQPPQQLLSQPMFHPGTNPHASVGSTFPQGQPPLPSQPPPQQLYQAGSHVGADFNNPMASSVQVDRGAPWLPGQPENQSGAAQLPGPPPLQPQPPRPPQLTPEMEKALLQQVMSLTPEQINLLPPEQRSQVLQLQQMLR